MDSMNGRLSSFSQVERKGHVFVNPALKQNVPSATLGIYQVFYFPFSRPTMRILVFYFFPFFFFQVYCENGKRLF